jgi:hypothetical protein
MPSPISALGSQENLSHFNDALLGVGGEDDPVTPDAPTEGASEAPTLDRLHIALERVIRHLVKGAANLFLSIPWEAPEFLRGRLGQSTDPIHP